MQIMRSTRGTTQTNEVQPQGQTKAGKEEKSGGQMLTQKKYTGKRGAASGADKEEHFALEKKPTGHESP